MEDFLETISAVGHETRVEILNFIAHHGRCCVCELEHSLGLGQARLSTNLAILKKAGFLKVEREGKWAYYSLEGKTSLHVTLLEEIKTLQLVLPHKIDACVIKGENS